ncbi:unnamed protein product, partial [Rotaria socialis]
LTSMDDETLEYSAQRKRGRPKGSITPVKKEIKQEDDEEKIEPTLNDDEKPNEPMKKKRGRPKGSIKSLNNEKNPVNVEIK